MENPKSKKNIDEYKKMFEQHRNYIIIPDIKLKKSNPTDLSSIYDQLYK